MSGALMSTADLQAEFGLTVADARKLEDTDSSFPRVQWNSAKSRRSGYVPRRAMELWFDEWDQRAIERKRKKKSRASFVSGKPAASPGSSDELPDFLKG